MKKDNLNNFFKGWTIGNITPTLIKTNEFEFAIKKYKAGDFENLHHHKIAQEITYIISGEVEMNGEKFVADDIIIIDPNESTDFKCLSDSITAVIKYPGANNDKYID